MNRFIFAALALSLLAFGYACSSTGDDFKPAPDEMLTEAETAALCAHVKDFVTGSKKLKLTDEQRAAIKANPPETKVKYKAPKEGRISLVWKLPGGKKLTVNIDGELLSEGKQEMELKITSTEQPIYLKADGKPADPLPEPLKKLQEAP